MSGDDHTAVDRWDDLRSRLERADRRLREQAGQASTGRHAARLKEKAEGVALALSYMADYPVPRGVPVSGDRPHWFADIDDQQPGDPRWQPCLETGTGHVPCFDVWFASRAECEDWIRTYVHSAELEVSR